MVGFLIPNIVSQNVLMLILFALFATLSWFTTKWFCKKEKKGLSDLGISFNNKNRFEFLYGLLIGIGLWAIVSIAQSFTAGFSWRLRPDFNMFNLLYGLFFIFIADLGTELYTRGYPLMRLKDSFGSMWAMVIMVFFVGLKSFSFEVEGEFLLYTIMIPALHTVFFSLIYFKTKRIGAALGVHTGANLVTISIFDMRITQEGQTIPSGIFEPDVALEMLSLTAVQLPYILMAILFSIAAYFWWRRKQPI